MVGLTIMFPQMVMHYKDVSTVDPSTIEIQVPQTGDDNGAGQAPSFDLEAPPDFSQPPSFD